jgi:HAD superfamily hydrolase (TIGR01509 family)
MSQTALAPERDPKSRSIRALLFDWDGTIVDSHQLGLTAFQHSFAALGFNFDVQVYREVYSPTWYSVYEAMGLPKDKWQKADDLWVEAYGAQTAQLVEGAEVTIKNLHDKGYELGIVSSGNDCRVSREISELGLQGIFSTVVCNEQMQNKKPHPEGLETAMNLINRLPTECCYVGDSPEDIEMGKSAGMLTVGVRSSYPTSWKLKTQNPDIYLESLRELSEHF